MLSCPKAKTHFAVPESGPAPTTEATEAPRTSWARPELSAYGDMRQLTMGPSPNPGESGDPLITRA